MSVLHVHIGVDGFFEKIEAQLRDFQNCGISHRRVLSSHWFKKKMRSSVNSRKIIEKSSEALKKIESASESVLLLPRFIDIGKPLNINPTEVLGEKLMVLGACLSDFELIYHLMLPDHSTYLFSQLLRRRISPGDQIGVLDWQPLIEILADGVGGNGFMKVWNAADQAATASQFLKEVCGVDQEHALRVSRTHTMEFQQQLTSQQILDSVIGLGLTTTGQNSVAD